MSQRRALIVGVDEYSTAPLSGCVNDAIAMAQLLERNEDGSPNFETRLLTAPGSTITRGSLRQQVEELFATDAEAALFYFAGHGTENDLGGYLVTPDAESYDAGVPLTDVLAYANNSSARERIIIVDSCHSGSLGAIPAAGNNDLAQISEGVSILTASRSFEAAMEADGSGIFTTLVCGALDGGAADVLGFTTVASIYAYVDQSLGAWDQRPLFKSHVSRLLSLRNSRPAVALEDLRRLTEWFSQADREFALDPSYEPTAEPRDAANEATFRILQQMRAAKLVEPVNEEHMYYAAMNSTGCLLTALGRHYWRLANEGRL